MLKNLTNYATGSFSDFKEGKSIFKNAIEELQSEAYIYAVLAFSSQVESVAKDYYSKGQLSSSMKLILNIDTTAMRVDFHSFRTKVVLAKFDFRPDKVDSVKHADTVKKINEDIFSGTKDSRELILKYSQKHYFSNKVTPLSDIVLTLNQNLVKEELLNVLLSKNLKRKLDFTLMDKDLKIEDLSSQKKFKI